MKADISLSGRELKFVSRVMGTVYAFMCAWFIVFAFITDWKVIVMLNGIMAAYAFKLSIKSLRFAWKLTIAEKRESLTFKKEMDKVLNEPLPENWK